MSQLTPVQKSDAALRSFMRLHADRLNAPFGKQLIAVKRNYCDLLEATLWAVRLSKRTFDGF